MVAPTTPNIPSQSKLIDHDVPGSMERKQEGIRPTMAPDASMPGTFAAAAARPASGR